MATPLGLRTILVIDDSHTVLAFARSTLEAAGFRVITRTRSEGTVALILQEKPDAVLVDPAGAGAGADTVLRLFGKSQPNSETLVLLYSGLSEDSLKAQVLSTGAHGHVRKSDEPFDLIQQIERCFKVGLPTSQSRLKSSSLAEGTTEDASSASRLSAGRVATAENLGAAPLTRRSSGSLRLDLPVVLFIDDDMGTLSAFRREVQSEPYQVEFALSGARAIQRILGPTPPRAVVSDLMMPEPSGAEVYQRVVLNDPSFRDRFVFVTGASIHHDFSGFIAEFGGTVLQKPVDGMVLRNAIRRVLGMSEEGRARQVP